MSTLVVEELKTTLTQTVSFKYDRVYQIGGIKIKVLMYNSPSGTFTLSIKSGVNTLASSTFTSADIKSDLDTTNNYAWVWKAVSFSGPVPLKKGSYDIELSASGYTYSAISFLGWVKLHESFFNDREDAYVDIKLNPYGILVYENIREDLVL